MAEEIADLFSAPNRAVSTITFIPSISTNESEARYGITIFWQITNISLLNIDDVNSWSVVKSPHFSVRTRDGMRLQFILSTDCNDEYLRVILYPASNWLGPPMDLELSILDSNGSPLVTKVLQKPDIRQQRFIVLLDFTTYDEVFVTRKSEFLPLDTLTVRFRMWNNRGDFTETEFISARSLLKVVENSFVWPIPEFTCLQLCKELTTPIRLGFSNVMNNFLLKLSLQGESLEDAVAYIVLDKVSVSTASLVSLKVSLYFDNEPNMITYKIPGLFEADNAKASIVLAFMSREEILRENTNRLKNDIQLLCEISSIECINFIGFYGIPFFIHFYGIPFWKEKLLKQAFQ